MDSRSWRRGQKSAVKNDWCKFCSIVPKVRYLPRVEFLSCNSPSPRLEFQVERRRSNDQPFGVEPRDHPVGKLPSGVDNQPSARQRRVRRPVSERRRRRRQRRRRRPSKDVLVEGRQLLPVQRSDLEAPPKQLRERRRSSVRVSRMLELLSLTLTLFYPI